MKHVKTIALLILLTMIVLQIAAQSQPMAQEIEQGERGRIEWVSQYPLDAERESRGFFDWLGDKIFGKEAVGIVKPVSVLASNPDNIWLLDQKLGTISHVNKNKLRRQRIRNRKEGPFLSLVDICYNGSDELVFTDSHREKIYKVMPGRKKLFSLNENLKLDQPTGVAFSKGTRELWVVETHAHRIVILDEHGKVKKTIGERGMEPGNFNFPTHIWIDDQGTAFIVDAMNFRIQIFDQEGKFQSMFGKQGDATGYFAMPKGIATDSYGNIYVVDALYHSVQVFDRAGNLLYYFGRQGREPGNFWLPTGIHIDEKDFIYVADSYNARVQIFKLIMSKE